MNISRVLDQKPSRSDPITEDISVGLNDHKNRIKRYILKGEYDFFFFTIYLLEKSTIFHLKNSIFKRINRRNIIKLSTIHRKVD